MRKLRFLMAALAVLLAVAGCHKYERYRRQSGGTDNGGAVVTPGTETKFELRQNNSWTIEYGGRQRQKGAAVEVIEVKNVPTNVLYLVSVINRENYASYDGDIRKFMETELEYAGDYIYSGSPETILFDPFRHGTWYAFIIAIDSNNKLTGEYNYIKFTVEEEDPTADFAKWLGTWKASDGKISYDLSISSLEANFMYRIDGWEVFDGAQEQMNQESLDTFYDNGDIWFTSQYKTTYEENGDYMEECFLGEIDYDGVTRPQGIYLIQEENIDLACARLGADGKTAEIIPAEVITDIDGEEFRTVFYDMKYFAWSQNQKQWFHYNDEVAVFPMTMTKIADVAPATKAAISTRGVQNPGKALRGKVYVPKEERRPAKAVFARSR